MDYTYQYCIGNDNITQGELQTVLEELMDEEFNTLCDDCSIPGKNKKNQNSFTLNKTFNFILRNLSEYFTLQANEFEW